MTVTFRLVVVSIVLTCVVAVVGTPRGAGHAAALDIVLYAADVTRIAGNWTRMASTSGAAGLKLTSEDRGWSSTDAPLAAPADFFEFEFDADAEIDYRIWIRLRAAGDSKWNESVWLQFSGATAPDGSPLWRIGTGNAKLVNLENCGGCGVSGWGWQDGAWWLQQPSTVRFETTGRQRLRVQTREDGVDIDQVVLSPSTYLSSSPGRLTNDTTIVSRSPVAATGLVRQPYLQQVSDSSAIVVWTTREIAGGEVQYESASGARGTRAPETRLFQASLTGLPYDYFQHEARLTGLAASTRYGYTIVRSETSLSSGDAFVTAPPRGTGAVRFIAFGDSGVGSAEQRQLAGRMTADVFDLSLHTGDVVYGSPTMQGGGSYAQYGPWFFDIYAPWLRSRPFFPSIGNHDDEVQDARPYRDLFVLPEHGAASGYGDHAERFYSFDYGPVHFVAIDTELAFRDPARRQAQLTWLEQDLAATSMPWRVAYMHRSPYTAGTHHGSDLAVRQFISPILERHRVQLALTAHEHTYERTIPLQEHTATGAPVTYIVTGGGGAPVYPAGTARWTAASASVHHYVRGHADTCTLSLEAVNLDGAVFDRVSLDRCSTSPSTLRDVVLYASDVTTVAGNWARLPSSSGAQQMKMASADQGWSSTDAPRTAPSDYFEASFDAPAGAYRVWLRLRGAANSKYNESVWVQFSDATDAGGAPLWRIGSPQALLVNLEDCGGCGVDGWGWQDNAWWLEQSSVVRFSTAARHTIRVQTREDGVEVDQIVLSPQRYLATAPGGVRSDGTIVSR
jgi:hypothetical protein